MRNKMKLLAILFVAFVLLASFAVACEGEQLPPTEIPTFVPLATATSSPIPTSTPTITSTPSPTEITVPLSYYDLPAWMADPDTNILADLFVRKEDVTSSSTLSSKLSFLNAATGEWYDMQIPSQTRKYFWYDNTHFGLLSDDLQTMYLLDLRTGQVFVELLPQSATRFLEANDNPIPLRIKEDPISPGKFLLDGLFYRNMRYSAEVDTTEIEYPITVTAVDSGMSIWQSDPSDGYRTVIIAWSPANDSYLAVVEGEPDYKEFDYAVKNITLKVHDVTTGSVVAVYRGDIGSIRWSPDGTKILYQDELSLYWNFGFAFTDAPCIFNIQTGENKCIWNIPQKPTPSGFSLTTTSRYKWSPDGKSIYFVYTYEDSEYRIMGNLCIYDLMSGQFTCPTDHLSELPEWNIDWPYGWNISWYDFSPDMEFIHFCYSSNHPLSDDGSGPSKDGVIDIEGGSLVSWYGKEFEAEYSSSKCSGSQGIWRPLP